MNHIPCVFQLDPSAGFKFTAADISAESKLVGGSAGGINEKIFIENLKKKIKNFSHIPAAAKSTDKIFIFGGGGALF